jgi:hypothetical protein
VVQPNGIARNEAKYVSMERIRWKHTIMTFGGWKKKNILNFQLIFKILNESFSIQWPRSKDICIYNIFKIFIMYILDLFGPKNGGLSFQHSRNIRKWKWNGKIKPCPHVQSLPLLYGSGFYLKQTNYFTFIAKNKGKVKFSINFQPKKPLNGPRFSWCILISFPTNKFTAKLHS